MTLTGENYHSLAANNAYMSVSGMKAIVPQLGGCPARAMAVRRGEFVEKESPSLLEGRFIHAWNEGPEALEKFIIDNKLIATRGATTGQLKKAYVHILEVTKILEADPIFMASLAGQKEYIGTAMFEGMRWKFMIDSLNLPLNRFADLKYLKLVPDKFWNDDAKCYENVFEYRNYYLQISMYAELYRLQMGHPEGHYLYPMIPYVTKQTPPDFDVVSFDLPNLSYQDFIAHNINVVRSYVSFIKDVISGRIEAERCGKCDYCRSTKKLKGTRLYTAFDLN